MFKQVKSALIWYHLYKFRKTVIMVVLLLSSVLFSQWIYSDIVEYLTLREKLEYLDILLPLKWAVIFFNIALSVFLVLRLFKVEDKEVQTHKKETKKIAESKENKEKIETIEEVSKPTLSKREESFLHTKKLNTHADRLVKR